MQTYIVMFVTVQSIGQSNNSQQVWFDQLPTYFPLQTHTFMAAPISQLFQCHQPQSISTFQTKAGFWRRFLILCRAEGAIKKSPI